VRVHGMHACVYWKWGRDEGRYHPDFIVVRALILLVLPGCNGTDNNQKVLPGTPSHRARGHVVHDWQACQHILVQCLYASGPTVWFPTAGCARSVGHRHQINRSPTALSPKIEQDGVGVIDCGGGGNCDDRDAEGGWKEVQERFYTSSV